MVFLNNVVRGFNLIELVSDLEIFGVYVGNFIGSFVSNILK